MGEPRSWGEFTAELVKLIGLTGDTGGSQTAGTVFAKENAILEAMENGAVPAVKSVQRGYIEASGVANAQSITIQISEVDVSKAFVALSGYTAAGSNHSIPWVTQFTPTSFTVNGYGQNGSYSPSMRFSWQVVDFC